MLSNDDKLFELKLVADADIRAWKGLENCKTHWEEVYYNSVIEMCERIEKELLKK